MIGNRGIYHQGWTAVTKHRTPWKADTPPPFDDDVWELYGPDDWTQAHDLAAENPAETGRAAAALADRGGEVQRACRSTTAASSGSTPTSPGRPQLIRGNTQLLFDGMRVSENCVLTLKNKSLLGDRQHRWCPSPAPTA